MDAGSQLTDCWERQEEDAGGWTRKAPLPVEWSGGRQRDEAKG